MHVEWVSSVRGALENLIADTPENDGHSWISFRGMVVDNSATYFLFNATIIRDLTCILMGC